MRIFFIIFVIAFLSCSQEDSNRENQNATSEDFSGWNVPIDDIGGGISQFPLMDDPEFVTVAQIEGLNRLNDNSLLGLLKVEDQVYAFPYDFTTRYEIINGSFDNEQLAFTYCPLTQSALCFNRKINSNESLTLKASGYLYRNNLIPMDIDSERCYSQMTTKVLKGGDEFERLNTYNIFETTWSLVKQYFPEAMVFTHDEIIACEMCNPEEAAINYEKLFGVIDEHFLTDEVYLYNYNNFSHSFNIDFININNRNTIIIGNKDKVIFNAFYIPPGITFTLLTNSEFPLILSDNEGNKWDIFGFAMEGPRTGLKLDAPKCYLSTQSDWENIFTSLIYR